MEEETINFINSFLLFLIYFQVFIFFTFINLYFINLIYFYLIFLQI